MEVLSPVGNRQMLEAAVRSGADAVYLGLTEFNARRNADNFEINSLKDAVSYCHIRGVKVYLTLNIMLYEREMERALLLAKDAYLAGIDGIIISDLGLARLLKEKLPLLPLHASTQMTLLHKDSLPLLKSLGFVRAVAAREMSKKELEELCQEGKKLGIEIEVFVHGALCMCISGQCLMSSFLGGRSGNRGLCASPCRLPFLNISGNENALSLKDLSLLSHISELKEMGVASIKIEGRMKRSEYVAAVTSAFSSMIDKGYVEEEILSCLNTVFSRSGFTDGYFLGKTGKEMFGISRKEETEKRSSSFPFIHEMIRRERQCIPLKAEVIIGQNAPSKLTLTDGINTVSVTGEGAEKTLNIPITKEKIAEQISKLGSTPYYIQKMDISLEENCNIKISSLNEIRRKAVELLNEKRSLSDRKDIPLCYKPQQEKREKKDFSFIIRVENTEDIPLNVPPSSTVFLPAEKNYDLKALKGKFTLWAELPRAGLFGENLYKRLLEIKGMGFDGVVASSTAHIDVIKQVNLPFIMSNAFNIASSAALKTAEELGADSVILSPEMNVNDISLLKSDLPLTLFAYGKIPLMITKNCPAAYSCESCKKDRKIIDRMGVQFNVKCRYSYSEIFNSVPIILSDRLDDFKVDRFLLYFTDENKEEIAHIISCYVKGKETNTKFTRGLYYKGAK